MTNSMKGEVALHAGEVTYKLVYDVNALCAMEDKLDKSVLEIMGTVNGSPRLGVVRALLWAGLRRHHEDVTLEAAGDLVMSVGMVDVLNVVMIGFKSAFPKAAEGDEGDGGARPPKPTPKAGTGSSSLEPGTN